MPRSLAKCLSISANNITTVTNDRQQKKLRHGQRRKQVHYVEDEADLEEETMKSWSMVWECSQTWRLGPQTVLKSLPTHVVYSPDIVNCIYQT